MTAKIQKNWLDRALDKWFPETGLRRTEAKIRISAAESYVAASKQRRSMKEWRTSRGDADTDLLPVLDDLRQRSRDLSRNDPLACGAIATQVTCVVGTGLTVQAQIDSEYLGLTDEQATTWQKAAEREFGFFANSKEADVRRTLDFYGLQELAFRQTLENGDVFAIRTFDPRPEFAFSTRYQLIEADRISNPLGSVDSDTLHGGVECDDFGAPLAYHICSVHPGDYKTHKVRRWDRIEAFNPDGIRNVLHVYRMTRSAQSRGVPLLSPVIESLKMLGRYSEAELMAAVISGMFTVFVKSESGDAALSGFAGENGPQEKGEYKLGNGAIVGLAPDEDITISNPGRPNSQFDPFVLAVTRQIGVALEMPYEVLIKHFTASYSASKGALIEAWRMFKSRRNWFGAEFCQPIYETIISEAVAQGRLIAPGFFVDPRIKMAYLGSQWIGDAQGQLDPFKEVMAQEKKIQLGLSTRQKEIIETNGGDFESTHKQLVKEETLRREAGLSGVAATTPVTITDATT